MGTVCVWVVFLQQDAEHLLRLGLAVACGFAVGVNRLHASHSHPGRVRVHVLVALSACLFALAAGGDANATSRAIQGVATGVGFLGAGEILVEPRQGKHTTPVVRGLTSAAVVWFTAALGITAGVASPFLAGMALLLALLTLSGPLPPQPPNKPQS
jgi:putative Mg2+ transporter-C (MgtC) family protein